MNTHLFVTWGQYRKATPEEQQFYWKAMIDLWSENDDNQLAVDTQFDHSEALAAWLDDYTIINGDASRIREAGRLSSARARRI